MLLFVICWPCFELYFGISAIYLLMFEARGGPLANRHPPIILLWVVDSIYSLFLYIIIYGAVNVTVCHLMALFWIVLWYICYISFIWCLRHVVGHWLTATHPLSYFVRPILYIPYFAKLYMGAVLLFNICWYNSYSLNILYAAAFLKRSW